MAPVPTMRSWICRAVGGSPEAGTRTVGLVPKVPAGDQVITAGLSLELGELDPHPATRAGPRVSAATRKRVLVGTRIGRTIPRAAGGGPDGRPRAEPAVTARQTGARARA